MEKNVVTSSFVPSWSDVTHIEGGCFLPLDNGTRTPYPEIPPQSVLDIANTTYGQVSPSKDFQNAKFHYFPKLPIELRKRIWWFSLPGSRIVEVYWKEKDYGIWSECQQPVTIHICHESREVALGVYKLAFKTISAPATIYFDFEIDVLYFGAGNISNYQYSFISNLKTCLGRCGLKSVQHVAADSGFLSSLIWTSIFDYPSMNNHSKDDHDHIKSLFPALQSLTLVVIPSESQPNRWDNSSGFETCCSDIIIAADDKTSAEFRLWNIQNDGSVLPWNLPLGPATWEVRMSELWRHIELHHSPGVNGESLVTLRLVSLAKLGREQRWKNRSDLVNASIYFNDYKCLFEASQELRRLLHLRKSNPYLYHLFGQLIARHYFCIETSERLIEIKPEAFVDPIIAYRQNTPCRCLNKHQAPAIAFTLIYGSVSSDDEFDIKEEMRKLHTFDFMNT
ncbi:hypothetical protein NHQ30_001525 [Ciborinia camelliae]|nr:hypothetical protein NHQ30_001525 [Ciborinia camelliae]